MSEASSISLKAIGKQDTYLISKETPFLPKSDFKHSNFVKYHRDRNIVNPGKSSGWPFGQTLKIEFKPKNMGDLLSNIWLSLKLPKLESDTNNYADQVGRHILKSVTMYVDEIEVEKIYDDWGIIHDELYLEMSEKITNAYLLNRNLGYDSATLSGFSDLANYETELMIPIPFFFSRKYGSDEYKINEPNKPHFPVCAIHKQQITFELEFHKQTFFSDTSLQLALDEFDIITEEITISDEERLYMMGQQLKITTDFVKRHPSTISEVGKGFLRNNLVPNIPVKCLHWFFRRQTFENEDVARQPAATNQDEYYYHNRFNFSTSETFGSGTSFFGNVMKRGFLYLLGNRLPNITDATSNYYKYKIPSDTRLSIPIRNIYTYSFAIRPKNSNPSGIIDFGNIQSDKTIIDVELTDVSNIYSMHMYYTGYQTMQFKDGFMQLD